MANQYDLQATEVQITSQNLDEIYITSSVNENLNIHHDLNKIYAML